MSFILGMDTGGTYTDGVVLEGADRKIICKAKALTTKDDLTVGLKNCLDNLEFDKMKEISLVSLSTTLATNAIVEGRGGKVALIYMGVDLEDDVPAEYTVKIKGKFDIMGRLKEDLDEDEIKEVLISLKDKVDAIAISGYASVRNSDHEKVVKAIADEVLNVPVICAHQLTSALGFQHRTVTAVLNGKLIPIIDDLMRSTKKVLKERDIDCPIMIVKGDGTLMTEEMAKARPVETILSGPAASVIGGLALTGEKDGLVVDMGGTTTDIADVIEGSVRIKKEGANVGGWFTRVQAAEISTFGIGGDSRICLNRYGKIEIGPEKVIPLCVAGAEYPELIHEVHSFYRVGDMKSYSPHEADCYAYLGGTPSVDVTGKDAEMIEKLKEKPHSVTFLGRVIGRDPETIDLTPLVEEGVIARIGVTPTDILHAQGKYNQWNRDLSHAGINILAKRYEVSEDSFISEVETLIKARLASTCVQAAANFEGEKLFIRDSEAAMYLIDRAFKKKSSSIIAPVINLKKPLVAIGAPAGVWLKEAGELLNANVIVPDDADVANAYGAAVGQVTETVEMLISVDGRKYILNTPWQRYECATKEEAMFYAIHEGRKHIEHLFQDAGCRHWNIEEHTEDIKVELSDTMAVGKMSESEKTYMGTKLVIKGVGGGMI
ncbi:MAG: glutamate mutase L [Anaerovoracaceae bacterium]